VLVRWPPTALIELPQVSSVDLKKTKGFCERACAYVAVRACRTVVVIALWGHLACAHTLPLALSGRRPVMTTSGFSLSESDVTTFCSTGSLL
jgi:hypothetical protein